MYYIYKIRLFLRVKLAIKHGVKISFNEFKNNKFMTRTKFVALITIFVLLSSSSNYSSMASASAQVENFKTTQYKIPNSSCKCVIFRLDDTNSNFLPTVQINVMDQFISKNQSLSLGIIMHKIDDKSPVTEKIKEGKEKGLFELDLHGWDHVDYTQLSAEEQLGTLQQANDKMNTIFGQYSQVFIPPYNKFNGDTIGVLKSVGVKIISADTSSDKSSYFVSDGKSQNGLNPTLYHLPAITTFKADNGNGTWIKIPIQKILNDIDESVSNYGYAVVLLHPQNFAKMENGMFVDITDANEIKDLTSLIDSITSKNFQITTFANVVGLNNVETLSIKLVPEFHGTEIIILIISISFIIWFTSIKKNQNLKRFSNSSICVVQPFRHF